MFRTKSSRDRALKIAGLSLLFVILLFYGTRFISGISGKFYLSNPTFHILFSLNLLVLLVIFVFLIRNIFLFFIPHRSTRLRFKLVTAFSLLILGPSLFAVIISTSFVNKGLDRLFRLQMKRSVETSLLLARESLNLVADDIARFLKTFPSFKRVNPVEEGFEGICRIGKSVECKGNIEVEPLTVKKVLEVESIYSRFDVKKRELTVCVKRRGRIYCASRKIPSSFVKNFSQLEQLQKDYNMLKTYERPIKGIYTATFLIMAFLVLFGALWFARYFEKRINIPVESLYRATKKISRGNLDVKVEEEGTDELKNVIVAFNYMVEQLKALKEKLESEKNYVEKVINSISPAVITVSKDGEVISYNLAALSIVKNLEGRKQFMEVFSPYPEIKATVQELLLYGGGRREISEIVDGNERFLSVEVIPFPDGEGSVVIIEDFTEMVNAQKMSAWKEVAQRLAHEIKNPLTPISLSAERVRRLISKQDVPEELKRAVDKAVSLIVEEVEIIRRLVDEFRTFARLPLPEKKMEDLNRLIETYALAYGEKIKINFDFGDIPEIPVDKKLFREVFLNLMENSIDAGATAVSISTFYKDGRVYISFRDNGPGIPENLRDKIFSPHMSTKKSGWGLGLAIAKRIIEDHGGKIYLVDGNTFVIELPA
ncbi:sensor histidine kinase [Desulfurobacterium indicum]|uniref:histidine kinase n=1 Tax=Desulfurobacterium indicum TaxID=1914305 RepID=A0A1R1MNN9_9BACT|nr:ATP-binding protein [Desulfurobacterium indicum]OMH41330.1 sensor histidine kinase [Desulfurobacterium indicum]